MIVALTLAMNGAVLQAQTPTPTPTAFPTLGNGSFESSSGANHPNWTNNTDFGTNGLFPNPITAHDGTNWASYSFGGGGISVQELYQTVIVTPGHTYRLSTYAFIGGNAGSATAELRWGNGLYPGKGNGLPLDSILWVNPDPLLGWVEMVGYAVPSGNLLTFILRVKINGFGAGVDYDACTLTDLGVGTPPPTTTKTVTPTPTNTPLPSSTPTFTSTPTVTPTRTATPTGPTATPPPGSQLIGNPSFELPATGSGQPITWVNMGGERIVASEIFGAVDPPPASYPHGVQVVRAFVTSWGTVNSPHGWYQQIPVVAGQNYTVSGRLWTSSQGTNPTLPQGRIGVDVDGASTNVSTVDVWAGLNGGAAPADGWLSSEQAWSTLSRIFTANSNTVTVYIDSRILSAIAWSGVHFDLVELYGPPPPSTPTPTQTSPPASTSTPTQTNTPVPPTNTPTNTVPPVNTATPTNTAIPSTATPTPTRTATPTATGSPVSVIINPPTRDIHRPPASAGIADPTFTVEVRIVNVTNLGAFEFDLHETPSLVSVTNASRVKLGSFLGSTGNIAVPVGPVINNASGIVEYGAFTFGGNPGPNGNGLLAKVDFTALFTASVATTPMDLQNVLVTDTQGSTIGVVVVDGQVRSCFYADIDCDNDVDIVDIQLVAGRWNTFGYPPNNREPWDVDWDTDVDIVDIQLVAGRWNQFAPFAP